MTKESFQKKTRPKWIAGIVLVIIAVVCLVVQKTGRTPTNPDQTNSDRSGTNQTSLSQAKQAEREKRQKELEAFRKLEEETAEQARRSMAEAAANLPVSIFDGNGKVTPGIVGKLKLSQADVQALQNLGDEFRTAVIEDLKQRMKLSAEGENEEGKTYSYHARASKDRGKGLEDEFWQKAKGILGGENAGSTNSRVNAVDYPGHLGQFDMKIDVFTKEGVTMLKFQYVDPESGANRASAEMPMESFNSKYGEIVQLPN